VSRVWRFLKSRSLRAEQNSVHLERDVEESSTGASRFSTHAPRPDLEHAQPIRKALDLADIKKLHASTRQLLERLEQLTSFKSEFATVIVEPVSAIISEHAQVQAQLVAANETLSIERGTVSDLTSQLRDLRAVHEKLLDEHAIVASENLHARETILAREREAATLRAAVKEHEEQGRDLERRLCTASEERRLAMHELQAVRQDAQQANVMLAGLERDLMQSRAALEALQTEHAMVLTSSGEQSHRLNALEMHKVEISKQLHATEQEVVQLRGELEAERSARRHLETDLDTERQRANLAAALEKEMQGLSSRITMTEAILQEVREQLRQKIDALTFAESNVKRLEHEKDKLEQGLAAAQHEIERHAALAVTSTEERTVLAEQCGRLNKEIAAKGAELQRSEHRAQALLDRVTQLTRQSEQKRAAFDLRIQKLSAHLRRERSERALAEAALQSARQTRTKFDRGIRNNKPGTEESSDTLQSEATPGENDGSKSPNARP
jgi:chromosome segregation ATPase